MREPARLQAAIDLLDQIIPDAQNNGPPADRLIGAYFKTRRYAGSKDRRAVRELVYRAIRACGPVPANGRAAMLRLAETDPSLLEQFDGSPHGPAPVRADEKPAEGGVAAPWIMELLAGSDITGAEAEALLGRAPLDIRINTLKAEPATIALPEAGGALPLPSALRLPAGTPVEQWDAYRDGKIEVQDLASQLAIAAMAVKPGEAVIDLCAGAGGKTLALAAAMQNQGRLVACDTNRQRLSRLAPRAERAGANISETILLNPGDEMDALAQLAGSADHVLVDAPCSGSGTWRRKPDSRWRLSPDVLAQYNAQQFYLLSLATKLVRPGGKLTYAVCSVLDSEGTNMIAEFLAQYPGWGVVQPGLSEGTARGEGLRLTPYVDDCDGFFVAILIAPH